MDDNCKKKLAASKKFIQQSKYAQALDQLEVMGYKYPKVFQVHLMLGLCYEKLNRSQEAQRAYLQVLDLSPNDTMALKQLCEIYTHRGDIEKGTKYLERTADILRNSDDKKYRETIIKLISHYEKDLNMQKIDGIFQQYCGNQKQIGQDFVRIAQAYFKVGITNQCFFLQKFEVMGMLADNQIRLIVPGARQNLNHLLIEVVEYLNAVSKNYNFSRKDIANSIMELKLYFPESSGLLMMMLFDQYCVGQMAYSSHILGELYLLCSAHFDNVNNCYHNLRFTAPEIFSVCMLLAREYLCFFKEFFSLQPLLEQYYPKLASIQDQMIGVKLQQDHKKKIDNFILKQCRQLSQRSKRQNIEAALITLRLRIEKLQDSYLEQVLAKIALHAFSGYDQLNDMKYKLKVRIRQIPENTPTPHLYKYYYDYVLKMARIYKSLDEELPLRDVLNYIVLHDPSDLKFQLELVWFQFGMQAKHIQLDQRSTTANIAIKKIQTLLPMLQLSAKSSALRRIIALRIYSGDLHIQSQITQILILQRTFQNLQCAAFFNYQRGNHKQALTYLRQAFRLNQSHYHTNRLFLLTLFRCGQHKQAYAFLEHLLPSSSSIFWVNFLLGVHRTTQQRFSQAQTLMVKAYEAFQAGSQDGFRFFYEKVYDIGPFSLLHLAQQNQYSLFYDQIIFPEQFIYQQLPLASNIYFQRNPEMNRMKLLLKQGELLKILGRTKSALNCLQQAYNESLKLSISAQTPPKVLLNHALVRKQYSTLLFYSSQLREAEEMLFSTLTIIQWMLSAQKWHLAIQIQDEIQALFFQISISRLSMMIKFESQQCISNYLQQFRKHVHTPERPSLTFLKNKYQFHILQFMHQRLSTQDVQQSASDFLKFHGLDLSLRTSQNFALKLQQLSQADRKFVRECIQDYYIVLGLHKPPPEEELLHMLTLFPRSASLCVLFGSVTADVRLKTASFLKVIQLDRQSSISMDILASLYLKQKNYLAAAKLFLKSLQTDVLNPKCYLGLTICLLCLIIRAVEEGENDQIDIVKQCLIRINSYMEFIRLNDPSQNYHLLSFLRLLLSDNPSTTFNSKLILQSANKNCLRYRETLLGQLLQDASKHWKLCNFWCTDNQLSITNSYISKLLQNVNQDHVQTAMALAKRVISLTQSLKKANGLIGKQISLKKFSSILLELGLSICLSLKSSARQKPLFEIFVKATTNWQKSFNSWNFSSTQLSELKKKIKSYLYQYILLGNWQSEWSRSVDNIFPDISSFDHLVTHNKKIPKLEREITRQLLLNPANEQIRQICSGYQVGVKGWSLRKAKLSHRLELHNTNNSSTTDNIRIYKQLSLLYRDPTAIILYIARQWSNSALRTEQNVKKWLKLVNHICTKKDVLLNQELSEKGRRLVFEMIAFLQVEFNYKVDLIKDNKNKLKIQSIVIVFKIMKKIEQKQDFRIEVKSLSKYFKESNDDLDWWIFAGLISYIVRKFQMPQYFEKYLNKIHDGAESSKLKAFVMLIQFLLIMNRATENEEKLVEQIVSLTEITQACRDMVSPTTEVILQCSQCLASGSWDSVEAQLSRAVESVKVTSYSDQVLINFFEVLKQYKSAENNPNGEGVIDSFLYMVENMLEILQQPKLRGFMLGLKGIVMSLSEGEKRSIKLAMLLSPVATKGLLTKSK